MSGRCFADSQTGTAGDRSGRAHSTCAQTQKPPRNAPRLPVNAPVGSFTNALTFVVLSEFFSCILYTEVSESWTTPFLARKVHNLRVTKNTKKHGSDLIRPTPKSKACPATCHPVVTTFPHPMGRGLG